MKSFSVSRIRLLSLCILCAALLIVVRLYMLQVMQHDLYVQKADRQYSQSATGVFSRGTIYFSNKDGTLVSAATLKSGYTVAINPEILKNTNDVYTQLSTLIPLERDQFMQKTQKKNDPYEELAKRVDLSVGDKISALNITGLQVYKDRWRFYPGNALAANTIGFLAYQGNDFAGRYGLESTYNTTLARAQGTYVNFFAQIFSNIKKVATNTEEGDIITTIEPSVQSFLEQTIQAVNTQYSSTYTGGIIIDPKTGEIVAIAGVPTFDLNNTKEVRDVSIFSNPLVENVYEMGSIIKPLTVSAGIDTGTITASSTYFDKGYVTVNNKKISNFDGKERGVTTIQTALSQSLNVGMAYIVSKLGNKVFSDYMYKFGLGQKTGVDVPNEAKNIVSNLNSPRDIEHVTASFGQGIALSPISTVAALSVVANGGYSIHPHIVKQIQYTTGHSKNIAYTPGEQVIKQSTSEEVTRMMVRSVDEYLHNGTLKMPNYSVAVKTGTAQIARNGVYSPDDFLHSFVGYFPAYNPKFLIFLYTVKPRGVQYGSESLADPFMSIVKFLINYYEIPPDR